MKLTIEQIHEQYEPRGDGILEFKVLEIKENGTWPYIVAYKRHCDWIIVPLNNDLKYNNVKNVVSGFDLIPKEERITGWVNVYKDARGCLSISTKSYGTYDEAFAGRETDKSWGYFATIHIDEMKEK